MTDTSTGASLGGITSGVPSVFDEGWYAGPGGYGADPLSAVLPEMQICVRNHIQKRKT